MVMNDGALLLTTYNLIKVLVSLLTKSQDPPSLFYTD